MKTSTSYTMQLLVLIVAIAGRSVPILAAQPGDGQAAPSRAKQLAQKLTNSTLVGMWQMTRQLADGTQSDLTPPKPEKYVITKATKLLGDRWVIAARITFGDKDVTLPVPVRIVWAEDTPIITLNELDLPGIGTYSARVMIFGDYYAGTWFGDGYGGVLSGKIVRNNLGGPAENDAVKPSGSITNPSHSNGFQPKTE